MPEDWRGTTFAQRLAHALHLSGLNQQDLARELRTYHSRVSIWCNSNTLPAGRYMLQLPGLLNVNGHWLLTGHGQPHGGAERSVEGLLQEALDEIRGLKTAWSSFEARCVRPPSESPPSGTARSNGPS